MRQEHARLALAAEGREIQSASVMVNFICQLDWDRRHSGIWSHMIINVSVRAFMDEISI